MIRAQNCVLRHKKKKSVKLQTDCTRGIYFHFPQTHLTNASKAATTGVHLPHLLLGST